MGENAVSEEAFAAVVARFVGVRLPTYREDFLAVMASPASAALGKLSSAAAACTACSFEEPGNADTRGLAQPTLAPVSSVATAKEAQARGGLGRRSEDCIRAGQENSELRKS